MKKYEDNPLSKLGINDVLNPKMITIEVPEGSLILVPNESEPVSRLKFEEWLKNKYEPTDITICEKCGNKTKKHFGPKIECCGYCMSWTYKRDKDE